MAQMLDRTVADGVLNGGGIVIGVIPDFLRSKKEIVD
jgi:predicted Rossmann-fold nucleotide-binding protein